MEIDKNLLIKINELIGSDNKVILSEEDVIYMLEELVSEIERLEEEFENYKEYVKDNYRFIPSSEMYGIDNSDFIEILYGVRIYEYSNR